MLFKAGKKGQAKRERETARARMQSRSIRDIGTAPVIADRSRREMAFASLDIFLTTCFPKTFSLPFSDDHRKFISRIEHVVIDGGQYAVAMPRGSGKTAILERAIIWAVVTGRRRFAVLIAATDGLAIQSLNRIKSELERNDSLLADFPKVVYPIRKLEGETKRCVGQLSEGVRTRITWHRNRIILPTMAGPENQGSGSIIHAGSLGAAIRGLSQVVAGETIRPDLLLCDDPQDRESAASAIQTTARLSLMNGDLLGLSGPNTRIAALPGTVIFPDDLIDQLLDREKSPAWTGEKFKLLYSEPTDVKLWEEYQRIRTEAMRADEGTAEATEFYRQHREAMDLGAVVSWVDRIRPGEISAIQTAMNLKIDLGDQFDSEYQNTPRRPVEAMSSLQPAAIMARCGGYERGTAGPTCEKLTAFIDVGQGLLWWIVCAWSTDFGCNIVDYGSFPEQRTRIFTARNAPIQLETMYTTLGQDGAVFAGLRDLTEKLYTRTWSRSDGGTLPLSRCLIDSGWASDIVRTFIRQSTYRNALLPSKGMGIGPGQVAIAEYRRRPGENIGSGWILGVAGPDRLRLLRFDANLWKTRVAGMLTRPTGGVTLYGDRPVEHQLLALHLSSEYPTPTTARGVTVNTWAKRPDRDNHLFDALCGCAVAASVEGINPLAGVIGAMPQQSRPIRRGPRISYMNETENRIGYPQGVFR